MNNNQQTKKHLFRSILSRTCCIFTPTILILYTVGALLSTADKSFIPTFPTVCIIAVFSFAVSLSYLLYNSTKLSFAAAHFINFILMGIFYYFVVVVMRNSAADGGYTLVAMVFYILIFAIATLCILGAGTSKKKKINDVKSYTSKFE